MNDFRFIIPNFTPPAGLDRNQNGWGVVFFIKEDIFLNYGKVLMQQKDLKTY